MRNPPSRQEVASLQDALDAINAVYSGHVPALSKTIALKEVKHLLDAWANGSRNWSHEPDYNRRINTIRAALRDPVWIKSLRDALPDFAEQVFVDARTI